MRKTILLYGGAMAVLIGALKIIEYSYLVKDLAAEAYAGILAVFFTILGGWIGWKLTHRKIPLPNPDFRFDEARLAPLGISKREYEVLTLIAQGLSNREIADKLYVSTHTVKSHSSSLFMKLGVRRRTEAVKRGKELWLIS